MLKRLSSLTLFISLLFLILSQNTVSAGNLPKIKKVKVSHKNNLSEVRIELTDPLNENPKLISNDQTTNFSLKAVLPKGRVSGEKLKTGRYEIDSKGFISKVILSPNLSETVFEVKNGYFSPVNFKIETKPPAIVAEFPKNYFLDEPLTLKPGIVRHLIRTVNSNGPVVIHLIEIDPSYKNISFKVGLPDGGRIKSKETLSKMVKDQMAYIGINANYFDVKAGNPLGTTISEGSWLIGPIYNRVAIGFSKDNKVFVDQVMLTGQVTAFRGFRKKPVSMFEIDGLNTPYYLHDKIGFYTKHWDKSISPADGWIGLIVKGDHVKEKFNSEIEIPQEDYVLLGKKETPFSSLKKNDFMKIVWQSNPNWSEVSEAISGGPYLLMNGEVYVDQKDQKFKFTIKDTYTSRTAIGLGSGNKIYLIAADGRIPGHSAGVSLMQLAELLKRLGLKEAINLDGGGSTTLVVDGMIINKLSDKHERKISNGLLVFYK